MGVYIKDMEMPTTCGSCWFCHAVSNEKWHCRLTGKSFESYSVGWGNENNTGENGQHPYIRRDDCPLVPVPPHGDLIDRGYAIATACSGRIRALPTTEDGEDWIRVEEVRESIKNAPTIIPAEEGET